MKHQKTPAWVVANFLPDYANRLAAYIAECRANNVNQVLDWALEIEFCAIYFPEALEKLLQAQKDICAHKAFDAVKIFSDSSNEVAREIYARLKTAPYPQPKKRY